MKKRLLFVLLALCLVMALLPAAFAADTSGSCGDNLTWSYSGGVLSIEGTGPMTDFTVGFWTLPWSNFRDDIHTVEIGSGVTTIGNRAFSGLKSLTSLIISNGVTSIGECAFDGCSGLTSVTIPGNVTTIGNWAFSGCTNLTDVTISGDGAEIDERAFSDCTSLTSVTILGNVTTIGNWAFYNCTSLTDVTISGDVAEIVGGAFSGCTNLTNVTISGDVAKIADWAFSGCTNLTDVTVSGSVTTIGENAFSGCTGLTSVTILGNVTTIGNWAFYNCTSLTNVTISGDVAEIVGGAFSGCTNLTNVTISGDVAKIADWAFSGCANLTNVTISGDVSKIADWAFSGCTNLTDVTISGSVTTIGENAFSGCTSLTDVTFSGSVIEFGGGAFSGCTGLTNVTFSGSVPKFGGGAFSGCTSLTDVTISGDVAEFGDWAFSGCTSLTSLTVSGSVTSAGYAAFNECASLKSVTISGGVTSLGDFAFSGCTALEEFIGYPDKAFYERIAINKALLNGWNNPGQYVGAQSARITALANELTAGLTSDYEKAKAIASWVSENIEYDWDYYEGRKDTVVIDPEGVLDSRLTICDGYSQLTEALLQAAGIPARRIGGVADNGEGHAWNVAFVDGRWIWMDTTWGMSYFDCGIAYMARGHEPRGDYSASDYNTPYDWAQAEVWDAICAGLAPYDVQSAYHEGMTREDFCRLMVRLLEKSTGQGINAYLASKGLTAREPFADTDSADIAAAYVLGIVYGTSDTTFEPNGSITRQQAAAMLARTARVLGLATGSGESFTDTKDLDSWAVESIAFVSGLSDPVTGWRVMNGTGEGRFSPWDAYTREQAIMTALRLFHCAA